MNINESNQTRTAQYLDKFNREKVLKLLINTAEPVIYDVGANSGSSLDEFKSYWPAAYVHSFEPQVECYEELVGRASRYDRVVTHLCAVGSEPTDSATFYTHDVSSGLAGFHRVNLASHDSIHLQKLSDAGDAAAVEAYRATMNRERRVRIVRLDAVMRAAGTGHIDLLKIDTEGFEPEVLEGCGERLVDVDVVLAELMFFDYYERKLSFSDVERYLLPAGFSLYDISHISKNPMNGRTDWVDAIYVNDRRSKGARVGG